jgi:hypothetical protein
MVEPLRALTAYKQFILWKTAYRDGKLVKLPVSPYTGEVCDAQDPSQWVDATTAEAMAPALGCNVAFVFTENDPFFFLDIDKCLQADGSWSPLAQQLCAMFPGAAVEVSQSGTGLHVFGRTTQIDHACKNIRLGIELYTKGRFVALTGTNSVGDSSLDCTSSLHAVVQAYFPPDAMSEYNPDLWTNQPDPRWTPISDIDIINKACAATSAAQVFGNHASFLDLWSRNVDVLAVAYPSQNGVSEYDESSADSALAQHLAFWCGNNCELILQIMMQSSLRRDKWTERKDYLKRTIIRAVTRQENVYGKSTPPQVDSSSSLPGQATQPSVDPSAQFLTPTAQMEYFKGCVYVRNVHKVFTPDGALLKPEQFKAVYGGYQFSFTTDGKSTTNAWDAFIESQVCRHPKVTATCFRPELEPGAIIEEENSTLLNTYVPITTPRMVGDPAPFLNHVRTMLPDQRDQEILLSYMAAIVQNPGKKFQWTVLLQGCEGNGKTLFITCMEHCVGKRYTHLPNAADLGSNGSKFNAWIEGKLFIGVEEIYTADRREIADALKPLITNARIEIQGKGSNQVTGDNRANFIMCSNHKDAVRKTSNDRRYCVLYTAQQSREDMINCGWFNTSYFPTIYKWLNDGGYAIVNEFLHTYRISDELNPAKLCHRAPVSSSTEEAISVSLGRVEQEILEAIEEGRPGFAGGWVSSMAVDRLLEEIRASNSIPRNKRRQLMESLGYAYHPALNNGRVNSIILLDGGKPRLFIKNGHLALNLTTPNDVAKAYSDAQNGATQPGDANARKVFGG